MTDKKTDTEQPEELNEGELEKVDGGVMLNIAKMAGHPKPPLTHGPAQLENSPLLDTPHIFDRTHGQGKG